MRNFKVILSLLLVAVLMCALFAACSEENEPQLQIEPTANQSENSQKEPAKTDKPTDPETFDEITEIKYAFFDFSRGEDHMDRIEAAVNEISEKEIGVHVNVIPVFPGDYKSKIGVAIAAGEPYDLFEDGGSGLGMYSNGQATDITDLLPVYAPNTYELLKPYLSFWTYNDRLYGVPAYRNLCSNYYILMRKDVLEEIGMLEQAKNMTTWSEYEEILGIVAERYADDGMFASTNGIINLCDGINGDNFSDVEFTWVTSDSTATAVLIENDTFELKQARQGYVDLCKKMVEWRDRGWMYPDSLYMTVMQDDLFTSGVVFSGPQRAEYGVEVTKSAAFGTEVVSVQVRPGFIAGAPWGLLVPYTSEEPEAALKFIELCNTNADVMNLFTRGQEGVDYELVDGQVKYVEGDHYHQTATFFGNELISTPLYGNGTDFYEKVQEILDTAPMSPYIGFTVDTKDLQDYIAQISAVNDQYHLMMVMGGYNETDYQDYLNKLEAAGANEYIKAMQDQLDAFLTK